MKSERIAIAGPPGSGKSTLAAQLATELGLRVESTDDLIGLPWSAQSERVAQWLLRPGPYLIEGVATVRGLRKALELSSAAPCDRVIFMHGRYRELSKDAENMAKGIATIWREIRPELERRGVEIENRGSSLNDNARDLMERLSWI